MRFRLALLPVSIPWLGLVLVAGLATGCHRPIEPRGVVLIVVDTVRADHLGVYGYERPTSPRLDRAAADGVIFERAESAASWTLPSFGSILTGRIPAHHGAGDRWKTTDWRKHRKLDSQVPTLAEAFKAAGWKTGALINNPWLKPRFGLGRGFDEYDYTKTDNQHSLRASTVFGQALDWIRARGDKPFFLLVHIFDPHMTYDPPASARGRFTGEFGDRYVLPVSAPKELRENVASLSADHRAFITAAYDEELLGVDQAFGDFFDSLKAMKGSRSWLVVLTSDHGEEQFDHGGFEHGHSMYQEVLHVPLIVWGPGVEPHRISTPVSLVDLDPTLREMVGLPTDPGSDGVSLAVALKGEPAPERRTLLSQGTLYGPERRACLRWPDTIHFRFPGPGVTAFDLGADPLEQHPLRVQQDPDLQRIALGCERVWRQAESRDRAPDAEIIDPTTKKELESLGYVQ